MNKPILLFGLLMLMGLLRPAALQAQQKYYTKKGLITFYSKSQLENIEANNKAVVALLDSKTGDVQLSVLMKGFEFEKALMQEHFNENYVESDKYPKAGFKGTITNNKEILYSKEGSYTARVKGTMTLHGIMKEIEVTGIIAINNGVPAISLNYKLMLSDYRINIPSLVKDKLSNAIQVIVNCPLEDVLR